MSNRSAFGVELRRARRAAGLSLADLSAKVHYSRGYLSKLENGVTTPTRSLAIRCDTALRADGRLVAALPAVQPADPDAPAPLPRRPELPADRLPAYAPPGYALAAADVATLPLLRASLEQSRLLGRAASPSLVLPPLIAHTRTVEALARSAPPAARTSLLALAAQCAEYAGWMEQEAGDPAAALRWTGEAVELAHAAGDIELVRWGLVRQAELSLYRGGLDEAITLLEQARTGGRALRVTGLALQWEAQAYALKGQRAPWRDAMGRATDLLAAADDQLVGLGSSSTANAVALVEGWCLLELGQPEEAAELLDREVPLVPAPARRAAARFGVQRAIARAAGGQPDAAVALVPELVALVAQVDSATVRLDLRRLRRELARWEARPAVAGARTELADALAP